MSHPRDSHDFEDELRVHLDMQAEDNRAVGHDSVEAERLARLRLGPIVGVIERTMEQDVATFFETWYRDIAVGFRSIRKNSVFAAITIVTIAVGIGANSAVFSLLYGLLLRSLPVSAPQQLARLEITSPRIESGQNGSYVTASILNTFTQSSQAFRSLGAWRHGLLSLRDNDGTLRLYRSTFSSGNSFAALGLRPYLGRFFTVGDDLPGAPPQGWPLVISYSFWASRFAADPRVIGKHIEVQGLPAIIIGRSGRSGSIYARPATPEHAAGGNAALTFSGTCCASG